MSRIDCLLVSCLAVVFAIGGCAGEHNGQRIPSQHEACQALDARLLDGVAQCPVVVHREHGGLLDQDVLAGLGRRNTLRGVDVVRSANVDDVDPLVAEHIVVVVVDRGIRAKLIDQLLGTLAAPTAGAAPSSAAGNPFGASKPQTPFGGGGAFAGRTLGRQFGAGLDNQAVVAGGDDALAHLPVIDVVGGDDPATDAVDRLLGTQVVADLWSEANRQSHEQLVRVLKDETGPVLSTADGVVTLELGELVKRVGEEFGLSGDVFDELPDDVGRVTIAESDELGTAQDVVRHPLVQKIIRAYDRTAEPRRADGRVARRNGHRDGPPPADEPAEGEAPAGE